MTNDKPLENPMPEEKPLESQARRPCLLVVDDDSTIRAMLQGALERQYEVICLANGDGVQRAIDAYEPRLMLLDINLPGSDGYDICRRVRDQARLKSLPILFMTVRRDDATFLKSLDSGGDSLICKTFEIAALRAKIEYLLKSRP